ncbi:ribose 5-phosphate isomerase B [Flavobacteriales bacterium]|nr:ribose 5-phosphate isomerase B [Flavobacteriales bacterium]
MNIAIGADHAGYELKKVIIAFLKENGYKVEDFGCYSTESIDYPDYAHPVCESIEKGTNKYGVLICGSGNGISMAANKHSGIRAALSWNAEIAKLGRLHNNANIVSIPARFVSEESALKIVEAFFSTEFEGGRHQTRVDKIACR